MLSAIIVCLLASFFTPFIKSFVGKHYHHVLSMFPLALFLLILEQMTWLSQTQGSSYVLRESYRWFPQWNMAWAFKGDGLSFLLAGLVTGVGTFVSIYAGSYFKEAKTAARFYIYFFLFMAGMLGVAFSDNFYAFFTFWELTSVASYLLIGFEFGNKLTRKNALQALLVTSVGGLCLLASFVLTHLALGQSSFSYLVQHSAEIQSHAYFPAILTLLLIGAASKSALFPFHFWLPNAMSAPTPASAYLHSATMVKAGIFLLARTAPAFDAVPAWRHTLLALGAITMLVAAGYSFFQTDLKKLLAYTTLGAIGLMTFALGVGTPIAVKGAMAFFVAHGFYKAALFLVVGIVDKQSGTRDLRKLGGLAKNFPFTSVASCLAAVSMIGLPPALSFLGKESILTGIINSEKGGYWSVVVAIAATSFVFVALHMIYLFFFTKDQSPMAPSREATWPMWIGPLLLGLTGLALPFFSEWLDSALLSPAYDTFLKPRFSERLSFWHGISWPLVVTLLSVTLGYGLFRFCRQHIEELVPVENPSRFSPVRIYDFLLTKTIPYFDPLFRLFQNGNLRFYLQVILWAFVISALALLIPEWSRLSSLPPLPADKIALIPIAVVQLIIFSGALLCLFSKRIFNAVLALSLVGFGIAMVYIAHGAPDLAMTQFLIETLTLVTMVLVLKKMPAAANFLNRKSQGLAALLSIGFGTVFAVVTYLSSTAPAMPDGGVSKFYAATSVLEAHGRNVVNVLLVDYRGFDTMGEITVLALAALGVFTLLKPLKPPSKRQRKKA